MLRTHVMRLHRRLGGAARHAHYILLKYLDGCRMAEGEAAPSAVEAVR